MDTVKPELSRISKVFVDREQVTPADALAQRRRDSIVIACGNDACHSYGLQIALFTAANLIHRCFPGAGRVSIQPELANAPSLVWPSLKLTVGQHLAAIAGKDILNAPGDIKGNPRVILLGDASPHTAAIRATFDGWIAQVGPSRSVPRLRERDLCPAAGILSASLAVSEIFLSAASICIEAGRRPIGLSLWRPDLDVSDPQAQGLPIQYLPAELWTLGLGHLGNAFLWTVGCLPYPDPGGMRLFLLDFDKIESENIETSMLFESAQVDQLKTRASSSWLEARGYQTRIIERRFNEHFRCGEDEPRLALCGFDSNAVRRALAEAQFSRVIECGLGGTSDNFDTISIHTLPNTRTAMDMWPNENMEERQKHLESFVKENPAYSGLATDECGRVTLAGKAVAVPFVGAVASTLAVSEVLRLLHGGPAFASSKLILGSPSSRAFQFREPYSAQDLAGIKFVTL